MFGRVVSGMLSVELFAAGRKRRHELRQWRLCVETGGVSKVANDIERGGPLNALAVGCGVDEHGLYGH